MLRYLSAGQGSAPPVSLGWRGYPRAHRDSQGSPASPPGVGLGPPLRRGRRLRRCPPQTRTSAPPKRGPRPPPPQPASAYIVCVAVPATRIAALSEAACLVLTLVCHLRQPCGDVRQPRRHIRPSCSRISSEAPTQQGIL